MSIIKFVYPRREKVVVLNRAKVWPFQQHISHRHKIHTVLKNILRDTALAIDSKPYKLRILCRIGSSAFGK